MSAPRDAILQETVSAILREELEDKPFKSPTGNVAPYWHNDAPEWVEARDIGSDYADCALVTLYVLDDYGWNAPDTIRDADGAPLILRYTFDATGEVECPAGWEGGPVGAERCPMCEEDPGEPHGTLYVGGITGAVYAYLPDPVFDRFDVCEAYHLAAADLNVGGVWQGRPQTHSQLYRIGFRSRLSLSVDTLSPNARAIYEGLIRAHGGDQ